MAALPSSQRLPLQTIAGVNFCFAEASRCLARPDHPRKGLFWVKKSPGFLPQGKCKGFSWLRAPFSESWWEHGSFLTPQTKGLRNNPKTILRVRGKRNSQQKPKDWRVTEDSRVAPVFLQNILARLSRQECPGARAFSGTNNLFSRNLQSTNRSLFAVCRLDNWFH